MAGSQPANHRCPEFSQSLEHAIVQAVAYADVFDYPLTFHEVHRYLVGLSASFSAVKDTLENGLLPGHRLTNCQGYVTLPGRESIVETRLRRKALCMQLWPKGVRYGLAIASLPFVRFVAVTGTLAVDNVDQGADIDYLIATVPGRVWLTRFLVLVLVYLARLEGVTVCPNYVISVGALEQFDHTLFTAHELAQMVPLHGFDVYEELVGVNAWARCLLPNAFTARPGAAQREVGSVLRSLKRAAERLLGGKLGDMLERWEMRHKVSRLNQRASYRGTCAVVFTPDCCKGHLDDHGERTNKAYAQRLRQVGLEDAPVVVSSSSSCALFSKRASSKVEIRED